MSDSALHELFDDPSPDRESSGEESPVGFRSDDSLDGSAGRDPRRRGRGGDRSRRALHGLTGAVRNNPLFAVLLLAGAALRLLVVLTFRPGLEFLQDSYDYILNAGNLRPSVVRPLLYPVVLRLVGTVGGVQLLVVLQHLAGLLAAGLVYATLCRLGVRRWLSALAVAPLLLDGYQLDVEQFVLSETLFQLLLAGLVACLFWNARPSWRTAAAAAVLGVGFTLTRTVGLPVLALVVLYLLAARVGWRPLVSFAASAALLLAGYGAWFAGVNGPFGLQGVSGVMLAGRTMVIADCSRFTVPDEERPLCNNGPADRRLSADWYTMHPLSPLRQLQIPPGKTYDGVARDFAGRVIKAQPRDFAALVWRDFRHYFRPGRQTTSKDFPVRTWQFRQQRLPVGWQPLRPAASPYRGSLPPYGGKWQTTVASYGLHGEQLQPHLWTGGQKVLGAYQRHVYTPGPVFALSALLALVAWPRRRDTAARRRFLAGLFLAAAGIGMLFLSAITAVFEYRYVLPPLVLLPAAGALGVETLLARRHRVPPGPEGDATAERTADPASTRLVSST